MTTLGIDVSAAQGHIDWVRVARWISPFGDRVQFAIVKATQGNGIRPDDADAQCRANTLGANAVDLLLGWYHFADPDTVHVNDPVEEAEHFLRVVVASGYDKRLHLLALDIEQARKIHKGQDFHDWVAAFLTHVTACTGKPCWLYTGKPFFDDESQGVVDPAFAIHPLWLAAYVPKGARDRYVPAPWTKCTLWQRSGDQAAADCSILHVDGIATNVDRDEFEGSIDELRALAAGPATPSTLPAPPPVVDDPPGVNVHAASTIADEAHAFLEGFEAEPDTVPQTPTSKSSQSMRAVDAPILDKNGRPVGGSFS